MTAPTGWRRTSRIVLLLGLCFAMACRPSETNRPAQPASIPTIDLAGDTDRQIVVDREAGQYLGHPTTVLLKDGRTILTTYPKGHGRGEIVYKKSTDGGLTWSDRLPVPPSWKTSLEVPTLFRVRTDKGADRILLFSGLYPIRMAHSEDEGETWSGLEPIGEFGGIVAMGSLIQRNDGAYLAFFHDDGRFFIDGGEPGIFRVYQTVSTDGGLSWSAPGVIADEKDVDLCEPGAIRSPDGSQIALLLRENSRTHNSFVIFSNDEGSSWSKPRELPDALTGDRHTAKYLPDGRLLVSFRDMDSNSETRGDWVAWVGTYDDIVEGSPGSFRVRIMDNRHPWDAAYPGVEILPDGTVVTTSYGHWTDGDEPYIVSVRFRADEFDVRLPDA